MTRIALITGGNRGLGRATALALAEDGVDSVITYRSGEEEARAVVAELESRGRTARALRLDTTDHESFPAFGDELRSALHDGWGRDTFDILVNNAGFTSDSPFGEVDPSDVDALYRVHVKGPVLLTDLLAPSIVDGGRILFFSTGLTRFVGAPGLAVYASMKGAIEVYARYVAKAVGRRGITVNAIAPGATATDFGGGAIRDNPQYRDAITSNHAFGRVGEPDDIGGAVRAIVSESAGWITGQRIEASGGQGL